MSSTYRPSAADMKEITSARDIMWIRLRLSHVKDQMDTWGFTLTTVEGPGDDDDDCVPVKGQLAPPSTPDNEYSETSKRASLASARASGKFS